MAKHESFKLIAYLLLMLILLLNRSIQLDLIVLAAQIIFSEQIISRALRILWLKSKVEDVYQDTFKMMQIPPNHPQAEALVSELYIRYEYIKATAGITLSSDVFKELNASVSAEWDDIKSVCKW